MPSTPTTKSQVHAYQFVIRRMESALVRKDAVMLHEPTRSQTRATVVGAILGAVGLLAFVVWGVLDPAGKPLPDNGIVISKQSGAVYVAMNNPTKMLVATPNLASARLLLVAMGGSASQGSTPVTVDESSLTKVSRGAFTGIPGAPELLPTGDQLVSPNWGICDQLTLDPAQPRPEEKPAMETTAYGGVADLGRKLKDNEGLLLKSPTGDTYLVFASDPDKGLPGAGAVRAKIDLDNRQLLNAMKMPAKPVARLASTALINSIPEVKELKQLSVPDKGSSISAYSMSGNRKVGDVVRAERSDRTFQYFLLLKDGIQEIPQAVAELMQTSSGSSSGWANVSLSDTNSAPRVTEIEMKDFPRVIPTVVPISDQTTTCLNWGERNGKPVTWVGLDNTAPTIKDIKPVQLAQADGSGDKVDRFLMPPGKAAVVRSATSENNFSSGPIFLVSDRGVRFGIPDSKTAEGLGLGAQYAPAPEVVLRTLPTGPILDPKEAARIFDSVKVDDSDAKRRVLPTQNAQPSGG